MRLKLPSKRVIEKFHLTYEMSGAQKGIGALSRYYGIRRMKIVVDGRKVGNGYEALYYRNIAYFTRRGFNRLNVLHEFYHHAINIFRYEMSSSREEKEASKFAREIIKIFRETARA